MKTVKTLSIWLMALACSSLTLSSCLLEEDVNNPEDVEYVIGLWKGIFMKNNCFFDFKEDMTVSIYSDNENMNLAMGFPHEYEWKTENDRIRLFDTDDGVTMSGILKPNNNTLEINYLGSAIIPLYRINE